MYSSTQESFSCSTVSGLGESVSKLVTGNRVSRAKSIATSLKRNTYLQVPFQQRVTWTAVTLLIFLVLSQVPLYGIVSADSADPLFWLRMIMASNRGTVGRSRKETNE